MKTKIQEQFSRMLFGLSKKQIFTAVAILAFAMSSQNAQSQGFLQKLKDKVNNAVIGSSTETKKDDAASDEEKISKVGKSFVLRGKDGNKTYQIADNAEMILEETVSNGKRQYYFTNGKKQYTSNIVTLDKDNNLLEINKFFIDKDQIANCVQSSKSSDNSIKIKFFTKSVPVGIRQSQDGYQGTATTEGTFDLYANSAKKANELQSLLLGAAMNGDVLNTYAYVTGDGKVVKTSAKPFWEIQGALYLEVLEKEKVYRVTYFEDNNTDIRHGNQGYLTKVTIVPFESIGNYTAVELGSTEVYLPLKKSVTKTIWVNSDNPTTEVITDKLKAVANNFNSTLTDEYCNIIAKAFPANVQAKFKSEIQTPRVAALKKQEAEAEARAREREREEKDNPSTENNNASSSKKKDIGFYGKLENKSDTKIEIVIHSAKGGRRSNTQVNGRSRQSFPMEVGGKITTKAGGILVGVITEDMEKNTTVIAQ